MQTKRWLLPCTHAVDLQAIDAALQAAEQSSATLVALSLVAPFQERRGLSESSASRNSQQRRLEQLQEAQDFLESVRWKARRSHVPAECHQIFTQDVPSSIATQCQELNCQSIVLIRQRTRETLLSAQSIKHVLLQPPAALLVLTLPTSGGQARPVPHLLRRFFGQQEPVMRGRMVEEEPSVCQVNALIERQQG